MAAWQPAYIAKKAREMGLDPAAVLAVADQEGSSGWGGRSVTGGIGDQGTSFGPFQLHYGGAYPSSAPRGSPQASQAWAMSQEGIDYALGQIQSVAKGLRGRPAIASIVRRFERPAAPDPEITRAWASYGKYGNLPAGGAAGGVPQGPAPVQRYANARSGAQTQMPVQQVAAQVPSYTPPMPPSIMPYMNSLISGMRDRNNTSVLDAVGAQRRSSDAYVDQVRQSSTQYASDIRSAIAAARQMTVQAMGAAPAVADAAAGVAPDPKRPGGFTDPVKGKIIGTPGAGTHTLGNWESDRALDVAVPEGTPVYAPFSGTVGSQFGSLGHDSGRFAGLRLHVIGPKDEWYGAHLSRFAPGIKPGSKVQSGQLVGYSGSANGVAHLHQALRTGDPYSLVR